jgi:heterotetrameric sarcosine oxidase gamma subunit
MPDIRSPLAGCLQPGRYGAEFATGPGLTLSESPVFLVQIAGWDDFEETVLAGLQTLGFVGVGGYRHCLRGDDRQLYRISPDRVLIASLTTLALPDSLLNTSSLAVQDLSHARTRISVEGPAAEDVMARLAPIDFRASAMPVDGFAQTGVHHVGVLIHRISAERFDILVPVTWACSLWDFICLNATPFGYDVRRAA